MGKLKKVIKIGTGRAIHSNLKSPHKSETWVEFESDNFHFPTLIYICQIVQYDLPVCTSIAIWMIFMWVFMV